jgi:hypothetical protein
MPTQILTVVPSTATPLPIVISFDSLAGWTPASYSGSGVFVSSATRGQTNTLTPTAALDLRPTFYPHLSFWQRGQWSPSI